MDPVRTLCLFSLCACLVVGKPTARKERVRHEPERSKEPHEDNQSFQFDHEAFLGKEEAKTFDQLSPEESRHKLGCV